MTHEEKLNAITADIREKLPRLMELKKGCLIREFDSKFPFEFLDIDESIIFAYDEVNGGVDVINKSNIQIIGKEPTILDCMEWAGIISEYSVNIDRHSFNLMGDFVNGVSGGSCEIDLSKPLLKENKELIDFLYELL